MGGLIVGKGHGPALEKLVRGRRGKKSNDRILNRRRWEVDLETWGFFRKWKKS